jgi:tetrahydromethanopterin S-methyltransferase subunit G
MFMTPFIAEAGNNDVVKAPNVMMNQANIHTIMSMLHSMDQKVDGRFESVSAEVVANREYCQQIFTTVNNNIQRYGGTIQSAFANQQRQQQERPEQQEPIPLFGCVVWKQRSSSPFAQESTKRSLCIMERMD